MYPPPPIMFPDPATPALQLPGHGALSYEAHGTEGFNAPGGILAIPVDTTNKSIHLFNNQLLFCTLIMPCPPPGPGPTIRGIQHAWYLVGGSKYTANVGVFTGPELYAIDTKMDDGFPKTGNFIALIWGLERFDTKSAAWNASFGYPGGSTTDVCLNDTPATAVYNLQATQIKPSSVCTALSLASF